MQRTRIQFRNTPERRRRRRWLLALTLGWPVVVIGGLALNSVAKSHAPAATLPMIWLLVLAFVIERMHIRGQ